MTDDRPRPKYGEYAPAGSTPIAITPDTTGKTAADAAADTTALTTGNSNAPTTGGTAPVEAASGAAAELTGKRRTWDVALTTALILVGVLDVVGSFARFGDLAASLREIYDQQGIGAFTSDQLADDMGLAINVTRVVLLIAGIGFGLWRLGRRRIAFWVPLSAGALAFIVVGVCLLVVVITDPALADYAMQQSTSP